MNDVQIKKYFKHSIVHPLKYYNNTDKLGNSIPTSIQEMDKIEVTLELCTIHKNKPFGPAIITYTGGHKHTDPYFKGAGVFDEEGELKTFTAIYKDG